jgi:hypothetical protein
VNVYSINIPIVATAYIVAENGGEALAIANRYLTDTGIHFSDRYQELDANICIDGGSYDSLLENEQEIALSPAMSLNEKYYSSEEIELVEELEEDEDA